MKWTDNIVVSLFLVTLTNSAQIHQILHDGLCLCVADSDVYARTGPGPQNLIAGTLQVNNCFVSKGGMFHDGDGEEAHSWYELKEVNGQIAWVDGFHLRARNATDCPQGGAVVLTGAANVPICFTPEGLFQEGDRVHHGGQVCMCRNTQLQCPVSNIVG